MHASSHGSSAASVSKSSAYLGRREFFGYLLGGALLSAGLARGQSDSPPPAAIAVQKAVARREEMDAQSDWGDPGWN